MPAGRNHMALTQKNMVLAWWEDKPITLPKADIAPQNRVSQKESSLPTTNFQVLC